MVHTDDDHDDSKETCTKKRKLIDGSNSSSDNDIDIMTYVGMTEDEIRVIEETPEQGEEQMLSYINFITLYVEIFANDEFAGFCTVKFL